MKFDNAAIPARLMWSTPFIRWQSTTADLNSLEMAVQVTRDATAARAFDLSEVTQLVYGATVPNSKVFYAAPWVAAQLGLTDIGGPTIAQACATSAAALAQAAAFAQAGAGTQLVVTSDRVSNSPLMVYPRSNAMGGAPATEHWTLDAFAADPNTGLAMVQTGENTARDGGFSREDCDAVALLRYTQYQSALKDDRAIQKRYFQPIVVPQRKSQLVLDQDDGVTHSTAEGLKALRPAVPGGVLTPGAQTHPADGAAGTVVTTVERAQALSKGEGVVRLLAAGWGRAEKACMPKAPAIAAQRALESAGLRMDQVKVVTSHNPFAVNDLWFAKATGFALEKMNPLGCSLVYGHPQGPTGLRAVVELVQALQMQGGGVGLFTGCAAGDMGYALVLRVE